MEEAVLGLRMPRTAGDEDVVGPRPGDVEDGAAGSVHTQTVRGADLLPGAPRVDVAVDLCGISGGDGAQTDRRQGAWGGADKAGGRGAPAPFPELRVRLWWGALSLPVSGAQTRPDGEAAQLGWGSTWFSSWTRTSRSGAPSASRSGTRSRGLRMDAFPPKLLGWLHRVFPETEHRT